MVRNGETFRRYLDNLPCTDEQRQLVREIEAFLADPSAHCFILKGYAGTGKTFLMAQLAKFLDARRHPLVLMAPTGRAAKVFEEKAGRRASTIHSHIYDPFIEEGKIEIHSSRNATYLKQIRLLLQPNEDPTNTIYLIDEASMISDDPVRGELFFFGSGKLLTDLMQFIFGSEPPNERKVIFIGDPAQLPPVGSLFSPALNADYLRNHYSVSVKDFQLRRPVRQAADSGIFKNALEIRNAIESGYYNQLVIDTSAEDTVALEENTWETAYQEATGGKVDDQTIVIAYTNAQVAAYNHRIRAMLFPGHERLCQGERLLVVQNHPLSGLTNGDFVIVYEADSTTETHAVEFWQRTRGGRAQKQKVVLSFRKVKLLIPRTVQRPRHANKPFSSAVEFSETSDGYPLLSCRILENVLRSDERGLSPIEIRALYELFRQRYPKLKVNSSEFQKQLLADPYYNALHVKFGYAVTGHKAQGGEWAHVFVDFQPATSYWNAAYFRWAYTVISRARQRLFTLHTPRFPLIYGIELRIPRPIVDSAAETTPPTATSSAETPQTIRIEGPIIKVLPPLSDDEKPPTSHPTAAAVFLTAARLLARHNLSIDQSMFRDWLVRLTITDGEKNAAVNIYYNSKRKVSSVRIDLVSDFEKQIEQILSVMKGKEVRFDTPEGHLTDSSSNITFPDNRPFLRAFYEQTKAALQPYQILVAHIDHLDYCERYHFVRGNETAVIHFWYTQKGRFKRAEVISEKTNSHRLLEDILTGMSMKLASSAEQQISHA